MIPSSDQEFGLSTKLLTMNFAYSGLLYLPLPVTMLRNVRLIAKFVLFDTEHARLTNQLSAFPPHTIISMPALSPTMTAGNIGSWQKKAGDTLAPGDVLVEIETDKAQMDFEFQEEGVLAKVLKDSGEKDVAVGSVSSSLTT